MKEMRYFRNRYLPLSLLLLLIALFIPGDNLELPLQSSDKSIHFITFFLVSLNLFYRYRLDQDRIVILFVFIGFGFLSEYIQHYVPGRFMDVRDGFADAIGICSAYISYRLAGKWIDKIFRDLKA